MKHIQRTLIYLFLFSALLLNGCAFGGQGKGSQTQKEETGNAKDQGEAALEEEDEDKNGQDKEQPSSPQIVFEAQDMEGNTVSSDILANAKITMINVWATYCNPCLSEMPGLGELAGEYDPAQFQLIGVISDVMEGGDEAQITYAASLIEQTGADYTHLLLNRSLYEGLLTGVSAVPTTFFLDENGVLLDTVIGAMDKSSWEEKINGLLEK